MKADGLTEAFAAPEVRGGSQTGGHSRAFEAEHDVFDLRGWWQIEDLSTVSIQSAGI